MPGEGSRELGSPLIETEGSKADWAGESRAGGEGGSIWSFIRLGVCQLSALHKLTKDQSHYSD